MTLPLRDPTALCLLYCLRFWEIHDTPKSKGKSLANLHYTHCPKWPILAGFRLSRSQGPWVPNPKVRWSMPRASGLPLVGRFIQATTSVGVSKSTPRPPVLLRLALYTELRRSLHCGCGRTGWLWHIELEAETGKSGFLLPTVSG